jgi:hypothetical protein
MLLSAGGFVYYRTETHVFNSLAPRCGDLANRANRDRLLDIWIASGMHARSGLDAAVLRAHADDFHDAGSFLSLVMGLMAKAQHVPRWADTTPAHLLHMADIREQIPGALFVHVIRDGRDVAVSLEKQRWIKPLPWDRETPVFAAAAFWDWMVRRGRASGRGVGAGYCEVQYEALVERPRETLAKLGRFIGQPLDYDRILANAVGSVARPNTSFPEARNGSFVGRWRETLPATTATRLDAMLAPTLRELGYATADGAPAASARLAPYHLRFALRHFLKERTPLGRALADLSLFDPAAAERPGAAPARRA